MIHLTPAPLEMCVVVQFYGVSLIYQHSWMCVRTMLDKYCLLLLLVIICWYLPFNEYLGSIFIHGNSSSDVVDVTDGGKSQFLV